MKKAKILIVEDELIVSANIKYVLQDFGYEIVGTPGTADEAIALAKETLPDLVLMDINLKDRIDGIEVAKTIKESLDVAIIFLTAYSDVATIGQAKEVGPYGYLIKPIENNEMYSTIEMALYKHAMEKQIRESEGRFRMLFDKAPLGYQSLDVNGNFLDVNLTWLDVLGYSYQEVMGKWFGDFLTPKYKESFNERFQLLKTTGKVHTEIEMVHKDGSIHFIALEGKIAHKPDGDFKQTHCILADITEQRKVEIALKESEKKYRNIFENVQDVYYETTIDGIILEVSPSISIMSQGQYHREELIGKGMSGFYTDANQQGAILAMLREQGNITDFETTLRNRDGSEVICSLTAKMGLNNLGQPEKIIGSMHDITKRKQAEIALKASEESLNEAQRLTKLGNWEYNFINQTETWSENCFTLYGLKPFEIVPTFEYLKSRIHPDDVHIIDEALNAIMINKLPSTSEMRVTFPDGNIKWMRTDLVPVFEDNKLVRLMGINIDITESKLAEDTIRESELRFQQVAENAKEWFWEVDKNGLYTYASKVCKKLLGYEPEEIVGKKYFYDSFVEREREQLKQLAFRAFAQKEVLHDLINTNLRKDGREVILSTSGVPMLDKQGGLIGYRGVDVDITERKRAERKLLEQMDEINKFNNLMVGREQKMIDLKKEINTLLEKEGKPKKYLIGAE